MAEGFDFNIKSSADSKAVEDLQAKVDALQAAVDALSGATVAPESDTTAVEDVSTAAGDAGVALEDVSSIEVAPSVDTSGLDNLSGAAGDAGSSFSGLSDDVGGASGAIGGMVGKATASIPGVSEALGPLRKQFVGMFKEIGEGLQSGNMNWGKLLATGAGMAVVEIALKGITAELKKAAEIDAFRGKEVDDFTKSIEKGSSATDDFIEKLTKAGKIEVVTQVTGKTDITGLLAKYGISVDQFAEAATGGKESLKAFGDAMVAAGVDAHDGGVLYLGAKDAADQFGTAQDKSAAFTKVFGNATAEAAAKTQELGQATSDAKLVTEQAKQTADNMTAAIEDQSTAYKDQISEIQGTLAAEKALIDAHRAATDANFAVTSKTVAYKDALAGLLPALAEAKGDQDKIKDAYDNAVSSAADLADAQVTLAEKQATASGETLTATQKQDLFNQSMLASAASATGPMKTALEDYINSANGIPAEKATAISAAIEAGDIETATRLINEASADRKTAVTVDVDQATLDAVNARLDRIAQDRNVKYNATGGLIGGKAYASGTSNAAPGLALVGEDGPELVAMGGGERVYPSGQTAAMLGGGHTYVTNNITIHAMDGGDVVEKIRQFERTNTANWRGG